MLIPHLIPFGFGWSQEELLFSSWSSSSPLPSTKTFLSSFFHHQHQNLLLILDHQGSHRCVDPFISSQDISFWSINLNPVCCCWRKARHQIENEKATWRDDCSSWCSRRQHMNTLLKHHQVVMINIIFRWCLAWDIFFYFMQNHHVASAVIRR